MYTSTSYQPMRTPVIIPRQMVGEDGKPTERRQPGCIHPRRPGRGTARRRAIAESAGVR